MALQIPNRTYHIECASFDHLDNIELVVILLDIDCKGARSAKVSDGGEISPNEVRTLVEHDIKDFIAINDDNCTRQHEALVNFGGSLLALGGGGLLSCNQ
jgi:hypothetical protein